MLMGRIDYEWLGQDYPWQAQQHAERVMDFRDKYGEDRVIDVHYERTGYDHARVMSHIGSIADTLAEIFARADMERKPTAAVADRMARQRVGRTR